MPQFMSRLGITGPSSSTGGSLRQASDPKQQVVEVRPGVDVGYPLRSTGHVISQLVSLGDAAKGTTTRPVGPELHPTPPMVPTTNFLHSIWLYHMRYDLTKTLATIASILHLCVIMVDDRHSFDGVNIFSQTIELKLEFLTCSS